MLNGIVASEFLINVFDINELLIRSTTNTSLWIEVST